jgi:hypothetical protein
MKFIINNLKTNIANLLTRHFCKAKADVEISAPVLVAVYTDFCPRPQLIDEFGEIISPRELEAAEFCTRERSESQIMGEELDNYYAEHEFYF